MKNLKLIVFLLKLVPYSTTRSNKQMIYKKEFREKLCFYFKCIGNCALTLKFYIFPMISQNVAVNPCLLFCFFYWRIDLASNFRFMLLWQ